MRPGIKGPVRQIDALQRIGCSRPLQAVRCKPAGPIPGAQHITHLAFADAKRQQALRRDRITHFLMRHDGRRPAEITAIGHLAIHEDRDGMTVLALHLVPRRPPVAQVGRIAQRCFQVLLVQRMMVRHPATKQRLGFLHQRPVLSRMPRSANGGNHLNPRFGSGHGDRNTLPAIRRSILGRHARCAHRPHSFRRTGSTHAITDMSGTSSHPVTTGIVCPVIPLAIHPAPSGERRHHGAAIRARQGLASCIPFQVPPTFRAGPTAGRARRGCRLRCLSHAGTRPGPTVQCDRLRRCVVPSAHLTGCWPARPPPTRSAAAPPARA